MKVYIPPKAEEGIGGGWSFTKNIKKALKDKVSFTNEKENSDLLFIPGATLMTRDDVEWFKENGKKIVLRVDNIPRNSRNRNTGTSRLYDFAKMADEVVYQSQWAKEFISPFLEKDGEVILNGVDTDIFKPEGDKQEKHGETQYLYIRQNRDETKRWEKAWYLFQKKYFKEPKSHLWIVGKFSPENREYSFDFFGGAEKRYKYWGTLNDPEDMARLYRGADILIMTYDMDACSNVLIEAMQCETKILWEEVEDSSVKEIFNTPLEELTLKAMGEKYLKILNKVYEK